MTGRRLAWWVGLAAGMAFLAELARGSLALPAPWHTQAFDARLRLDGAEVGAIALLRLFVMATGVYLVALGLVAELAQRPRLGSGFRAFLRLPLPGRALVLRSIGLPVLLLGATVMTPSGASASNVTTAKGAPILVWTGSPRAVPGPASPLARPDSHGPSADAPVLRRLPPLPATAAAPAIAAPLPSSTMAPVTSPEASSTTAGIIAPAPSPTAAAVTAIAASPTTVAITAAGPPSSALPAGAFAAPVPGRGLRHPVAIAGGEPARSTYVLVPGDHLWKVAEQTLTGVLERPPAPEMLARYWWQLVELNRARLPDPANPDFVLPGMTVVLPPVVP